MLVLIYNETKPSVMMNDNDEYDEHDEEEEDGETHTSEKVEREGAAPRV